MAASGSTSPRPISRSIDERLGFLQDLIGRRSVVTSDQQRIVSPSGREQTWLLDLRPVLLNGRALADIATLFWERFADRLPFQVCGLESACIPLLSAIVLEAERHGQAVNAVVIRKERKTNGLARDIEGTLDDTPVIVVDDLTNSSESLEKVRVVLADQGKRIAQAFVVVDYRASRSLAWRKRHAIEVHSLFGGESFGRPTKSSPQIRPAHRFEPLWSSAAPGANPFIVAPRSSPASDGRMLYAGTDGGALRAIDAETGAETWSFQAEGTHRKGIWSSPALADGKIVFGAYNGIVYGLDAATGREIWRSDSADWVGSSPAIARRHKLVLIGLEHAAPSAKGSIAALDLATGAMAWEFSVPHYIHGTPALSDDEARVFVGTNEGELLCLDTATGSLVWRYAAAEAIKAAPAVSASHGVVVAGSFDQCVHLVDSATGRSRAIVKTGGKIYSTALIIGDAAYIGSQDKKLYVIDLIDGSVIKSFALGGRIFAAPVLLDGIIYVGTTGGRLFGIDPASLEICDALQLPDRIVNPPLLAHDGSVMVVPVFGNRLFAFRMERVTDRAPEAKSGPAIAARNPARPLSAALIDAARPEGTYFRIDEPVGGPVSRPFPTIPSRRMLGAATLLMIHAPGYRDLSQVEVDGRVMPALIANQARVFLYGLQPIGMVTWAHLSAEAEARLIRQGGLPRPDEWCKGDRVWIIDVIAPFGGSQAMLDKVRRETLRGRTVNMVRPRAGGGGFDTTTWPP